MFALTVSLLLTSEPAIGAEARVAVASNFIATAKEIARAFEEQTDHRVVISSGSTGQIFAQITQAAPFEVFLAADAWRPQLTVSEGYGVDGSVFTYATGSLVLWSKEPDLVEGLDTLENGLFQRLAIANPDIAPYGHAAIQVLETAGVLDAVDPRLVRGNNIAQVYQFVVTGNADLGFVAASQIDDSVEGSSWSIPASYHDPIRQDAVLLKRGEANPAARAFWEFLQGPSARQIIVDNGYMVDQD
ncbi:MAG: molybdate ABC transporter substrate-binding protein [Pseudomonadota bacterium]